MLVQEQIKYNADQGVISEEKLKKNTKQQTNTNNTKTSPVGIIKRIDKVSSGHTQRSFSEA